MGITFRSGGYIKFVHIGGRTIKDGEAVAIWDRNGKHREIIGPRRVQLFQSTIRFLTRFKAESHQYLVVKHRSGKREHICGPAMLYENPAFHDEVSVEDGILLKSLDEYVVVNDFNKDNDGSRATSTLFEPVKDSKFVEYSERGIVQGPTLFVPTPNEVVHKFEWSTFCEDGKLSKEDKSQFHVIKTTSHSLGKSLISLEFELPNTHSIHAEIDVQYNFSEQSIYSLIKVQDPIMKLYQAMQADAIFIGNSISIDDICDDNDNGNGNRGDISNAIGDIKVYLELGKVAKECGIDISMLRVTKWWMNEDFMKMIRIERNLTSRVQSEFAEKEQRQKILQLDQDNRCKAIKDEAELKRMKLTSDDELFQEMHEKKMASLERKLALQALEEKAANKLKEAKDEGTLAFLTKLSDMDVDLTKYLTSHREKDSSDSSIVK